MTITYTWKVTGLKTTTQSGFSDVVVEVDWAKAGADENGLTGEVDDKTRFEIGPEYANFIPFDQLTEATVLGWVQASLPEIFHTHLDLSIGRQIAAKQYPVVARQFPWDA